jgi:probable addiction module antidote protein
MERTSQDRLILKLLNRALHAANEEKILFLFDRMIERQHKSNFAAQSGLNRVTLYRGFSPGSSPKLETVLKTLDAFALQFQCSPRTRGQSPPKEHLRMIAAPLSDAFATNEIEVISRAFGKTVHAQANIAEFSRRVSISRMSMYRWIQAGNALKFQSILKITSALGLRLEVTWRSCVTQPDCKRRPGLPGPSGRRTNTRTVSKNQ